MKNMWSRIKKWILAHEYQLIIAVSLIATACISFVFGFYKGIELSPQPLMITRSSVDPVIEHCTESENESTKPSMSIEECRFVGSVKGTKYYPPHCSAAQKIAKENLRCFTSEKDAQDKGYELSSSCN